MKQATILLLSSPLILVTLTLYPRFVSRNASPAGDPATIAAAQNVLTRLGMKADQYNYSIQRSFHESTQTARARVTAREKSGQGRMLLLLDDRLQLREWSVRRMHPPSNVPDERWPELLGGDQFGCFQPVASSERSEKRWRCRETKAEIRVEHSDSGPTEATYRRDGEASGRKKPFDTFEDIVEVAGVLSMIFFVPAAIYWTLSRRKRQRDHLKSATKIVILFVCLCVVFFFLGVLPGASSDSGDDRATLFMGGPALLLISLAPGLMFATGWQARSWLGIQSLSQFKFSTRRIGREILLGLAMGPLLAAVVSVVAWIAEWGGGYPALIPIERAFARFHFTTALAHMTFPVFVFGAAAPWLLRGSPSRWRNGLFALTLVSIASSALHPVGNHGLANVAASLPLAGLLWWLYRSAGMLAVMVAIPAAFFVPGVALAIARGDWPGVAAEVVPFFLILGLATVALRLGKPADESADAAELDRRNTPDIRDERSERERLLSEVSLAREAQQALLPPSAPVLPGYSIAAACIPAGEVGGDHYDYLKFPGGKIAFCVADVSGKGVGASVYNSYAKGMLAALAQRDLPLTELAEELNRHFLDTARRKMFVTMVLALLDPATRTVHLLRLGHNPPLLWRAQQSRGVWLSPGGIGVGLASTRMLQRALQIETVTLEAGDTLILYSDGLTEAMNPAKDLFGEQQLQDAVGRNPRRDAPSLMTDLLHEVETFRAGAEPNDDLTILVVQAQS